jgi:hypothetical protein
MPVALPMPVTGQDALSVKSPGPTLDLVVPFDPQWEPRLTVRLRYAQRSIDVYALLDSGAVNSLFPTQVADALGMPLGEAEHKGRAGGEITVQPGAENLVAQVLDADSLPWSEPIILVSDFLLVDPSQCAPPAPGMAEAWEHECVLGRCDFFYAFASVNFEHSGDQTHVRLSGPRANPFLKPALFRVSSPASGG